MSTQQVVVRGQIQPDGVLRIEEKVDLPPGPVQVTVRTATNAVRRGTVQVLEEIWAERNARGMAGRTREEIDAEIESMRQEDEERAHRIEAIQ